MSNSNGDRREIQYDFVVGVNLPMSEYLQMSTGLVIFDKFSSTEGQNPRDQMREAEKLWRTVLLSWFIVNSKQLAFISFPSATHIWRLLWKLCRDRVISFHCLRSGCSLKLTDWLGDTLRCWQCLDLCKKTALVLPFRTSSRKVINILRGYSSSNCIRAGISISWHKKGPSWVWADTKQADFSSLSDSRSTFLQLPLSCWLLVGMWGDINADLQTLFLFMLFYLNKSSPIEFNY